MSARIDNTPRSDAYQTPRSDRDVSRWSSRDHGFSGLPTMDDYKRKLDSEQNTIASKISDSNKERQELEQLKQRLVEALDEGRTALEVDIEKVDAKLGAITKMRHNEMDHGIYLEERLSELRGHLDGSNLNKHKFDELSKKLEYELQEVERKLKAESESSSAFKDQQLSLETQLKEHNDREAAESLRRRATIKAEKMIAVGLKESISRVVSEVEYWKRKSIIDKNFQVKQEAYKQKLLGELQAVNQKFAAEEDIKEDLLKKKANLEQTMKQATDVLQKNLQDVKTELDSENKAKTKLEAHLRKIAEQLEFVKGSLEATVEVKKVLAAQLSATQEKHKEAVAQQEVAQATCKQLQLEKNRLTAKCTEVADGFQAEFEEYDCKRQTCSQFIDVLNRYLERLQQDREIIKEKLDMDSHGQLELEELDRRLDEECLEVMDRIEQETKYRTHLDARKVEIERESQAAVARIREELHSVSEKLEVATQNKDNFESHAQQVQGELNFLQTKQENESDTKRELEVTKARIEIVHQHTADHIDSVMTTVLELEVDKARFEEEVESIRSKLEGELEVVNFRIGVQTKAVIGLEGFRRKLQQDVDFVEAKLKSLAVASSELMSHLKRLEGLAREQEEQLRGELEQISRLEESETRSATEFAKIRRKLELEIENVAVQMEADVRMRSGVVEYKETLEKERRSVANKLKSEEKARAAMDQYQSKLDVEIENYKRKADGAARDILELEDRKEQLNTQMQELKMKIGGDLQLISEKLDADTRSSTSLEGYKRKLDDELLNMKRKLGI